MKKLKIALIVLLLAACVSRPVRPRETDTGVYWVGTGAREMDARNFGPPLDFPPPSEPVTIDKYQT